MAIDRAVAARAAKAQASDALQAIIDKHVEVLLAKYPMWRMLPPVIAREIYTAVEVDVSKQQLKLDRWGLQGQETEVEAKDRRTDHIIYPRVRKMLSPTTQRTQ